MKLMTMKFLSPFSQRIDNEVDDDDNLHVVLIMKLMTDNLPVARHNVLIMKMTMIISLLLDDIDNRSHVARHNVLIMKLMTMIISMLLDTTY